MRSTYLTRIPLVVLIAAALLVTIHHRRAAAAGPAPPAVACARGSWEVAGPTGSDGRPIYLACLPAGSHASRSSRIDLRYGPAVSAVVGADAVVVCWSRADWARLGSITSDAFDDSIADTGGFIWDGQQVVNLPGGLCPHLDRVVYRGRRPLDRWTAWAFKNLTHEGIHVAGVRNESATECYALQLMAQTAEQFGVRGRYARALATLAWRRHLHNRKLEPQYYTPTCHNNGPLDLFPRRSTWP